ncbi:probable serine/threonine-protein kinase dyrk2 isoform X1 [Belonocnema kinseyi]|uniref:probable serine/threonine-protein kinase dyrk2 isoform X1 n=1 Tax=Belonocnema kinseyi TaxID=2817044 RepID=UPI00143CD48B|nr:probable serine/threonine-protein kinase dyrk2 isoform X1 [Belonocnema kinseyi]
MPYYGDGGPYYYGNPFANHSSLMTGTGRPFHAPLTRYSPHLSTISESPLSNLRRYSPVTITRRPRRTIDTADLDVSTPRTLSREDSRQRHHLRRDRPTIKIRSQAMKDNPALREIYQKHEKNVGELLVEKFLIKDKKYDRDSKLGLHRQPCLDPDPDPDPKDPFAEAIQRKVTRRFTRRRSSTDVQLNPEQLERELAFAQVQAEVLDTLVAEEQAEMEVEARKAFAKKKTHRSVQNLPLVEIIRANDSILEDDEEGSRIRKKVKKKKKSVDKSSRMNHDQEVFDQSITEYSDSKDDKKTSEDENDLPAVQKFKVEACNSVGDFSTLWIKSSPADVQARAIEQFRESIRLPAPKKLPISNLETEAEIVLPIPKPYVRDNTRNSVYLTLKKPEKGEEALDERLNRSTMSNDTDVSIDTQSKVANIDSKDIIESSVEIKSISDTLAVSLERKVRTKDVRKSPTPNATILSEEKDTLIHEKSLNSDFERKIEPDSNKSDLKLESRSRISSPVPHDNVIINKTAYSKESSPRIEEPTIPNREKVIENNEKISEEELVVSRENESPKGPEKNDDTKPSTLSLKDQTYRKEKTPIESPTRRKFKISKDKNLVNEEKVLPSTEGTKSSDLSSKDKAFSKESKPRLVSPIRAKLVSKDSSSKSHPERVSSPSNEIPTDGIKSPEVSTKDLSISKENTSSLESQLKTKLVSNDSSLKSPGLSLKSVSSPKKVSKAGTKSPESLTSPLPSPLRKDKSSKESTPNLNSPTKSKFTFKDSAKSQVEKATPPSTDETKTPVKDKILLKEKKKLRISRDTSPITPTEKLGISSEVSADLTDCDIPQNVTETSSEIDFWSEIKSKEDMDMSAKSKPGELQERTATIIKKTNPVVPVAEDDISNIVTKTTNETKELQKPEVKIETNGVSRKFSKPEPLDLSKIRQSSDSFKSLPVSLSASQVSTPLSEVSLSDAQKQMSTDTSIQDEDDGLATPTNESITKMTKWNNHDNLSNLNDLEKDLTTMPGNKLISSTNSSPADSKKKKKKIVKRKKSSTKSDSTETGSVKPSRKVSDKKKATPESTMKTSNVRSSPRDAPCRPSDLIRIFYTTPRQLMTATPRDLRKVRRAKAKKRKPPPRNASISSDSTGSTTSTQSTTTSTEDGSNSMDELEQKRMASTRSNDSGFDGSPRLSTPSQSSENQRNSDSSDHFHTSGRITPPATNLPRFKKYAVTDFHFLKVLGKGSFGKVLLAELRGTDCVYAVKCLKKDVVLEDDDVECTLIERKVLTLATRHPYLCHLFCTFQTESHLFFVMEYLNGGDLMFHIQKSGRFSEPRARFYAAEIWSGLNFLHKKGIVYRDLKLDNVLLDFEGHIRIADFGMCKLQIFLDRTADTFCGTPDYMAPEIIKGLKYNQAVDWWSFGILLYEMLTGQSPFSGCDEEELFWSICNERPFIPRYLSQESTSMLICLLEKDSGKRLPAHEIAVHPFFQSIPWDKLERRQLEAPFKPAVEHTLDTRYFDTAFTAERPRLTAVPEQILTSMDQNVFRGFSYTNPNATD